MADADQPIGVNPNPALAFVFDAVPANNGQQNQPFPFRPLTWRNRPRRRMMYNQAHREGAIALRQRGIPYRQIARRIGPFCSAGTIHKWFRRSQAHPQPQ